LTIAFEADSLQLIKRLVSKTSMLTCLPRIVFEQELDIQSLAACPLRDPLCSTASIDIITPNLRAPSGAARKFLAMLLDTAKTAYG
ncbi:MAG: LysR substrate-binding domain-containing protein, partial [Burkholderiaceae bacterium]